MPDPLRGSAALRAPYDKSRSFYSLLPYWFAPVDEGNLDPTFAGLLAGTMPKFDIPKDYALMDDEGAHEAGHAYKALLESQQPGRDFGQEFYAYRGFNGTWASAKAASNAIASRPAATPEERLTNKNEAWRADPNEMWAEAFARSVFPAHGEKTNNEGKDIDPFQMRLWFQSRDASWRTLPVVMTARVLIVAGHNGITNITADGLCNRDVAFLKTSTGTRGEQAWTGFVAPALRDELIKRGVDAVANDAIYAKSIYDQDWDLVLHLHLQRDRVTSRACAARPEDLGVCGVEYISAAARTKADMWLARFVNEYSIVSTIPVTQGPPNVTVNMTQFYGWDYLSKDSPGVLVECGNADVDAPVLYEANAARVVQALAIITTEYLTADLGKVLATVGSPMPVPPVVVVPPEEFPLSTFPVNGVWGGNVAALEAAVQGYTQGRAPAGWGTMLSALCAEAGVRADVAAAQAMHETGIFMFTNRANPPFGVSPEWNNYCGLKTTDNTGSAHFATMEAGLKAFVAHLSWYANPDHNTPWCNLATDPRHAGAHRNILHVIADYGGGVWNSSGRPAYGMAVARHLAEIRSRIATYVPPVAPPPPPVGTRTRSVVLAEVRSLLNELETL